MTNRDMDWGQVESDLDRNGWSILPNLLSPDECAQVTGLWEDQESFRSHIVMQRHGYGQGEYRYFAYPLPDTVARLRIEIYPRLAPIANRWSETLGSALRFPADHAAFIDRCHGAGQTRPTPLLLRYGEGDYNCLHQDLYGEHVFPLQLAVLLSRPEEDFSGGEFLLTEQRPRRQSRGTVVPLRQGDAVLFAVRDRPMQGSRGAYRAMMRHGVSTVTSGNRATLGIIFHDAA